MRRIYGQGSETSLDKIRISFGGAALAAAQRATISAHSFACLHMTLDEAYRSCMTLARSHYENFPVASRLMPRRLRPHVAAVYAFARHADDFADEGDFSAQERRAKLEDWRAQLRRAAEGKAEHPVFRALGDTMRRFNIPEQLFHDLLDAFVQDTGKERYADFD